jgi:ABC-type uncharacterized transport system permease subunit
MNNFETFIQPGLIPGLCYGIAAIGVSLPLRFLGTADFTAVGAIMLGGLVTAWVTNMSGLWVGGLCSGAIVAGLLGVLTAFLSLHRWLNIPLMLSGIICFTATQSLGLVISWLPLGEPGAVIELSKEIIFLSAKFSWHDAFVVWAIALMIIIIGGVLARSKWGCLAFGMCASSHFVKFRHRNSRATTYCLLFISNLLVGLCGGLLVLKGREAYTEINMEFLSVTLGAIYTGHAVVQLISRHLKRELPAGLTVEIRTEDPTSHKKSRWESFRLSLSEQRDDSERMWVIFLSYILASIALANVAATVRDNFSPMLEHLVAAMVITLGLFLSNSKRKSKRIHHAHR